MTASENTKGSGDPNLGGISSGNVHEEFKEVEVVKELIGNLGNIYKDQIAVEMAVEKFLFIVDQYQEQPHLLDPHLEPLMAQILDITRNSNTPEPVTHLGYKLLYLITKTRGYKIIVRLMPHEVADLEPVLAMLANQNPTDFQTWETRYMLLLWLSMVCMIPFDLVRLDSNVADQSGEKKKPIMERIIEAGKIYLNVSDKSRDAAAYMLSRFMTRPDVKKQKLPEILDWILSEIKNTDASSMAGMAALSGKLNTLALLFKHGKREDLVGYAPTVLELVTKLDIKESNNTLIRKLFIKMVQRLGLIFLKARVASWRYQRGSRSLTENLALDSAKTGGQNQNMELDDDEDYDIPDEIEDIIELLLNGLKDKDTIVRWSAAKGIGRVTGRLPKELADEVVGSLMELFNVRETDGAWQGGCLALAELGRRGLLLPERLPDVVPVIFKSLLYDEKRGNFSVGAHVRDASCYVCWAFARAYDPEQIKPHVNQFANFLLIVSILDREINVRRAASAAFQEHVGRQGQFPHGIDILTTCDYFAVGNRNRCYLELSVYVAQFEEYTKSIIDHLVQDKTSHWDVAMRELTSQALYNLTKKAPEYMAKTVLPQLIQMCTNIDLNLRHGAIMSAAQVTLALAKLAWIENKTVRDVLDASTIDGLENITPTLHKGQQFKGLGGELMRKAVCCLIEKLSEAQIGFHGSPIIEMWQELIDENLQHVEREVQSAAVEAFPAFSKEYYQLPDHTAKPEIREAIVEKYLHKLQDPQESVRMGYALAVGSFPKFFVSGKLKVILGALIRCCMLDKDKKFIEARRDAVKAMTSVCLTVGAKKTGSPQQEVCSENVGEIYDVLFTALKDYTLDSRGDVGAWVREAAMIGLYDITDMLLKQEPSLFNEEFTRVMFCNLVQQATEKIDRTRAHAGDIMVKLLYHEPEVPGIPYREGLQKMFTHEDVKNMNLAMPVNTFPKFVELLSVEAYSYSVLLGLTVSVGGLTESLVKYSGMALLTYLDKNCRVEETMKLFKRNLFKVFRDYQKVDRVTLPMLKMLDQLLSRHYFNAESEHDEFAVTLFDLTKTEIQKCNEAQKLLASTDVFCCLLQFEGEVRRKTLVQLSIYLCHRLPIVRKTTANKLYEELLTYDDLVSEENSEQVVALLSETQWDKSVDTVRPIRNQLCDLLGIPKPVALAKAKPSEQASKSGK